MRQKAKNKIIRNMIILLEEHPFEHITIKMICAYSGVNRTTFYDYFVDKYALLYTIQTYHLKKYIKLLDILYNSFEHKEISYAKLYKFFKVILYYIRRHYGFFHAIFVTHPNRDLFSDYVKEAKITYTKMLDDYTTVTNKKQFVTYAIGGQLGIIYYWVREGCIETPNEMAQILLANAIKLGR
ncbi:TetR/AcrR family transcriptional regulator [Staphylococcus sp. NAM3COL9]|uniref:TetR/AcrR family transcriptional regulator n=1 Tax=Staphylococcus sp. NAM3COL9 TaxID=1667172 RepID=UPI00070A4F2E|nr:TetR/AcrR family transcriptional regulator [Staphylococcus sp. NAM3COL9]KRG08190.1 TetR family transcriptional regulator [Staphylococcus sp. NAM3COL9]